MTLDDAITYYSDLANECQKKRILKVMITWI